MVCLDTDILIGLLRNDTKTIEKIAQFTKEEKIHTTAINIFELWRGVYKKKSAQGKVAVESLLEDLECLDLDKDAASIAAQIYEQLASRGKMSDFLDVLIAAIAVQNNDTLMTGNRKHFDQIQELTLV